MLPFQSLLGESLQQLTDRLDASGALARWAAVAPALSRAATTAELYALLNRDDTRPFSRGEQMDSWDELLVSLLQVAAHDGGGDVDAVLLTIYVMAHGANRLTHRGCEVGLVLGELTIQISTYPWRTRVRAVAANLLLNTSPARPVARAPPGLHAHPRSSPHRQRCGAGDRDRHRHSALALHSRR